jgi:hypothetical protein
VTRLKYTVRLPGESQKILREMADEAGISIADLIEIATYNLIALYIKDKSPPTPDDVVDAVKPGDDVPVILK